MLQLINKYILDLNSGKFIKLFLILFWMGLAYSFPIWLANRNYIDDLGRSIDGYTQWELEGRPFASWLAAISNFQYPWIYRLLVDTSPLLQFLLVPILASASALLGLIILSEAGNYTIAFVVFPIIGSPFLLQNLSYKFDALSMTTALAISITAAINLRNNKLDLIIGTLLLIAAYGLYQPSVNAFIGMTALLILVELWKNKVFVRNIAYLNVTKFVLASLIYKTVILTVYPPDEDYAISHSQLISITNGGLAVFINNVSNASARVVELFSDIPLLSIVGITSVVIFGARTTCRATLRRDKILNSIVFAIGTMILTFSIYGILLFLQKPTFSPRTFMGFTIFLVFLLFSFTAAFNRYPRFVNICLFVPIYYFYFLVFTYAAVARSQTEYDYSLAASIIHNLESFSFQPENILIFDGTQPKSPVLEKNSKHIKLIDRLIRLYIDNQGYWGYTFMRHQGLHFTTISYHDPTIDINIVISKICAFEPILVTQRYKIYRDNNIFIIAFQNGACSQITPIK